MEIRVLASGSKGNAYWISDGITPLLLECGIRFQEIREKLNFKVSSLGGCLVSHGHQDHCRAVRDMMKAGVDCYMSPGTIQALNLTGYMPYRLKEVLSNEQFDIWPWCILPFRIEHDADEPLGFLLGNINGEKLLYLTDSAYCRYRFNGLTTIMIECNYDAEILKDNVRSGAVAIEQKRRVMRSHFSLEHVKDFLKANDLSKVVAIYLLHLSESNSDAKQFKADIERLTGKVVRIA